MATERVENQELEAAFAARERGLRPNEAHPLPLMALVR